MPITGLERYIKTVLKMPSESIKSELITRLNNMSGLSGTPMSPLLTNWIQSNIGLFAVQKIQNYVSGGFSPDELRRLVHPTLPPATALMIPEDQTNYLNPSEQSLLQTEAEMQANGWFNP